MQSAYDIRSPNGSARRKPREALYVFRVYRERQSLAVIDRKGPLAPVRDTIERARRFIQTATALVGPTSGPLAGKILVKEFRFPLIVERVDEEPELRTRFQYVQSGFYLESAMQNARGVTRWRIAGRTHWRPVYINGVPVDGDSALKEFKELIEDIFYPPQGQPSDYSLYWLNLNAPISAEDPFGEFEWRIWPAQGGVRTSQHAQRPFLRSFDFTFLGLRSNRDIAKAEDGFMAGLLSRHVLRRIFDLVPGASTLLQLIDDVYGTVTDLRQLVDEATNFVRVVQDYIRGASHFVRYNFAAVRGLLTSIQTLRAEVTEGVAIARALPGLVTEQARELRRVMPGLLDDPVRGVRLLEALRRLEDATRATLAQPYIFAEHISELANKSVSVFVPPETSLDRLAHEMGVTPELLIESNGLRYPYIESRQRPERVLSEMERAREQMSDAHDAVRRTELVVEAIEAALAGMLSQGPLITVAQEQAMRDALRAATEAHQRARLGGAFSWLPAEIDAVDAALRAVRDLEGRFPSLPGVLYPGDQLRAPLARERVQAGIVPIEIGRIASVSGREQRIAERTGAPVTEEDRLFGIDILLDDEGNLVWDQARRDIAIVRGVANVGKTLEKYIRLPLGALRYAAGIGNFAHDNVAQWQGPGSNRLLAFSLYQTLRQDPRVREVRRVRAETHAGHASVQFDAELINGRVLQDVRLGIV